MQDCGLEEGRATCAKLLAQAKATEQYMVEQSVPTSPTKPYFMMKCIIMAALDGKSERNSVRFI